MFSFWGGDSIPGQKGLPSCLSPSCHCCDPYEAGSGEKTTSFLCTWPRGSVNQLKSQSVVGLSVMWKDMFPFCLTLLDWTFWLSSQNLLTGAWKLVHFSKMTKGIHPLTDSGQMTPKEALDKDFPEADQITFRLHPVVTSRSLQLASFPWYWRPSMVATFQPGLRGMGKGRACYS